MKISDREIKNLTSGLSDEFLNRPDKGRSPEEGRWVSDVMRSVAWSDPYIFFTSSKPGITIAGPIYNQSGKLRSIVGVDIEIDQLDLVVYIAYLDLAFLQSEVFGENFLLDQLLFVVRLATLELALFQCDIRIDTFCLFFGKK